MGRVLVIDDEGMIRDMLQLVLSRSNWTVDTADNAVGGLAKFDKAVYDLVITDVGMPGVDGHYVVHYIRCSSRGRTPIIGVSGTPRLLQGGDFDEVLPKPFALQALLEKINHLTEGGVRKPALASSTC
ncbi:MAG: response regulator [Desulfobacteraceae bacterium]|nr:MAG: response regulator [Desulfobacteraceae bacterium]